VKRSNAFQRAWRGQERLWKIYWGYLFLGSAILMIGSTIVVPFVATIPFLGRILATTPVLAIPVYWALVTVCMWRCAFNCGWRGWGIIAVGQMFLAWIGILLNVIAALLHLPPVVAPPIETP